MRPLLRILAAALLSVIPLSVHAQKNDTIPKIQPGVQWDTAIVIKPVKAPEHLIGVKYDFAFTGVSMTPKMGIKSINSPVNVSLLYTYAFENFEQTVSVVELPLISAFHIDIGEHFRILISIGPFLGYRFATTKENGFDCFDNRIDYGLQGGAGLAYIIGKRFELHLEGMFHYSLSMLYHPEKMSSVSWLYSYPWQAGISLGFHVKLK